MGYRSLGVEIVPEQCCLRMDGDVKYPRAKVFGLLLYLIENRDRVVPKEEIFERLWSDTAVSDNSLAQCLIDLRRLLGDDARNPRFIRTVPKAGYQFVATVEELGPEPETVAPAAPVAAGSLRGLWLACAAVLLAAGLAAAGRWLWKSRAEPPGGQRKTIAVVYFDNQSRTAELDWLREGVADMLATSLSRSPALQVITWREVAAILERFGAGKPGPVPLAQALELARRSQADWALVGGFAQLGGKIRVGAELHATAGGSLLASESVVADKPEEILAKVDLLAVKLAARAGAPMSAAERRTGLSMMASDNLEAYRYYSLGLDNALAYHTREALALFQKAVSLDPGFAMAQARIGYLYAVSWNQPAAAEPHLKLAFENSSRLTSRDRQLIAAWYAIAKMDWGSAIQAYRELAVSYPGDTEARLRLGFLLWGEGRHEEAIRELKRGLEVDPEAHDIHNLLGGIYAEMGRHAESIAAASRYVELRPGEANAHDSLGLAYQWAGRFREARECFQRALEIDPSFGPARIHGGTLNCRTGRYRQALADFRKYLEGASSNWERARGWAHLTGLYERAGELQKAEEAAREVLRHDPRDTCPAMRVAIGRGDAQAAQALAAKVRSSGAAHGARAPRRQEFFCQGFLSLGLGRKEEALARFREALRHRPPLAELETYEDCLAEAYAQLGRDGEAIAEYERLLKVFPGTPLAYYRLGTLLARQGRRQQARAAFRRFLEAWHGADPEIREYREATRLAAESD